jgi:hypothetical protein
VAVIVSEQLTATPITGSPYQRGASRTRLPTPTEAVIHEAKQLAREVRARRSEAYSPSSHAAQTSSNRKEPDMHQAPKSSAEQVAWLVDRAAISDLLVQEAHCLDTGDFAGLQALFVEDGYLQLPGLRIEAHALADTAAKDFEAFFATHHLSTNHAIEIDGDVAHSRSYFVAVHLESETDAHAHSDVGGWSDSTFRRVAGQWRFTSIDESYVWRSGEGSPGAR